MRAVVYNGPRDVTVEDVDEPVIVEPTDALVEIEEAGLCGSDLHIYHGETAGVLEGDTLGHEFVGEVLEVGSAVTRVESGDNVVGSFQAPCGRCVACNKGVYNGCRDLYVFGHGLAFGQVNGTQAERARIPRADLTLRPIPEGLDATEALFAGDILTAAYTGVRPFLDPGETVAVVGCGPVGLLACEVADALGAGRVYGIDLDPERANIATERGHQGLDPAQVDPVSQVNEDTDGWGADLIVEAVGGEGHALDTAFDLAAPGSRVVALGVPTAYEFTYPWLETFAKGVTFHATLANVPRWIDEVLTLQAEGRLEAAWLVSHRMALDDAAKAYELFDEQDALKVLLEP